MLTTTTHSKLREALDGTDTQVTTCAIDKWTAKMKRTERYITKEISRRGGRQFERRKEVLLVEYQKRRRRNHPRPRTSFDLPPNRAVDDPVPQRSRPTIEGVLTKAQFSSPLLYQIHCIGPIGFGFTHIYSERSLPNRDPTVTYDQKLQFCPNLPYDMEPMSYIAQLASPPLAVLGRGRGRGFKTY